MLTKDLFINGEWTSGQGEQLVATNPATDEIIWQGKSANSEQVAAAIQSARQAYKDWMQLSVENRLLYLRKFNEIVAAKQDELAIALAQDVGKPLWEAKAEITAMLNKLDISVQAQAERCRAKASMSAGITALTRHKPHGVVAILGPFNFPAHLPNGHIIPALLAGNTIVFKPSELTPLISIKIQECWQQANLPAGVLNMLQGEGKVGAQLIEHLEVDAVFFTGSAATGLKIQQMALSNAQRIIALEMGGNNSIICTKVKDQRAAIYNIIQSAFITSGQRCTCARRLILLRDEVATANGKEAKLQVGEEELAGEGAALVAGLAQATQALKIGGYTEVPEPFIGPIINQAAAGKIFTEYQNLVAAGAEVIVPMHNGRGKNSSTAGAFLTPAILDVTEVKERQDKEIFGPLLQIIWVDNFTAAIQEANNTSYGLAAAILTDDEELYREFYLCVKAGLINWNRPTTGASSEAPFGGVGDSGNYRPSAYYAADYCAYPVASLESKKLSLPENLLPGIEV